ncbi:S41 family peptidase [Alkaliphilus pronyensis]|uniref:S41 family peptidase n=1 Tax=Alkaliphilus pronyensis TaxID=1482732 RepID=A0A6I0F8B9_9FIRM|nr:S41 family peptidase [Alkaliphilus pronyensis]KAB3534754.1 S41 family peptidase [Alkaliphilus pronyensis]
MIKFSSLRHKTSLVIAVVMVMVFLTTASAYGDDYNEYLLEGLKDIIIDKYVDHLDYEDLEGETPKDLFENLDSHSEYYTKEEFESFIEDITGEFAGIGAYIEERDKKVYIADVISGAPAEKAGLKAGDEILKVDDTLTRGMSSSEVASIIRGPEDTEVTIRIRRAGVKNLLKFTITRGIIESNPIEWDIIDGIGYISIEVFNEKADDYFKKAVDIMEEKEIEKVIIDVRNNPGGSIDEVVNICRYLVPRGPVVFIEFKGHNLTYSSFLDEPVFDDIVVLANEGSASASEILAAAVQDTKAGVVVGKQTYGKGSVQRVYGLFNGGGYKLTEARYLSPNKTTIDGVGVTPNFDVDRLPEEFKIDDLLGLIPTKTINKGDKSDDVLAIQQRLQIIGYEISDEDGVYGEATQEAIDTFKKEYGFTHQELTPELQYSIDFVFRLIVSSEENDLQLQFALDYLKNEEVEAEASNQ